MGYIVGKGTSKLLKTHVSFPLLFVVSIISDVDLLIPGLEHRGLTHSIVFTLILGFPTILVWRKRAIPYLLVLLSHPIIGDLLTSSSAAQGVQLLAPLSQTWFAFGSEALRLVYISAEIVLFATTLVLMTTTRDLETLMRPHPSNLLLIIPIITALLPAFARFPIPIPLELVLPHLILIGLLGMPVLKDVKHAINRRKGQRSVGPPSH